ncbi:hypothetical protein NUM3379_01940 [Kineococcus sp. NUM-3379]
MGGTAGPGGTAGAAGARARRGRAVGAAAVAGVLAAAVLAAVPAAPPAAAAAAPPQVAFAGSGPGGVDALVVLDVAAGTTRTLPGPGAASSPSWSPAGTELAYVVHPRDGSGGRLLVAAADGSGAPLVTGGDVRWVSWSPRGRLLAWLGREGVEPGECSGGALPGLGLYLGAPGTGGRRVLEVPGTARHLSWSPDGMRVAWLEAGVGTDACGGSAGSRLVLADPVTGRTDVVTGVPQRTSRPRWSPDSRHLVLDADDFDSRDVVLVDAVAATARRLPAPGTEELAPAFSPDGTRLAWLRRVPRPGGGGEVVVARADGSRAQVVASTSTEDEDLVWAPDGRTLVFAGMVATPVCGDGPGCDFFTVDPGVYAVPAGGGAPRLLSRSGTLRETYLTAPASQGAGTVPRARRDLRPAGAERPAPPGGR